MMRMMMRLLMRTVSRMRIRMRMRMADWRIKHNLLLLFEPIVRNNSQQLLVVGDKQSDLEFEVGRRRFGTPRRKRMGDGRVRERRLEGWVV